MAHTCRGTINLAGAFIDTIDSCNFVITNGPSQVFHVRATNEIERQRWVTALELAKAKAIKMLESGECNVVVIHVCTHLLNTVAVLVARVEYYHQILKMSVKMLYF